ncbi:MAG TPA: hypothetical protein VNA30_02765 [Mycobacteriales bacterium]|nr:hypothetical protein [Mycobacteriales bacterium]
MAGPPLLSPAAAQPVAATTETVAPVIPLGGALALSTGGLLAVTLVLVVLATAYRGARDSAVRRVATALPLAYRPESAEGDPMSPNRRWRLIAGAAMLALAAVVAVIGWFKLSATPFLNEQVPYLASTGLAVIVLAVAGGALLVGEQMRTDDRRLDDIEDAVRSLAEVLAPLVEAPARTRAVPTSEAAAPTRTATTRRPRSR